MQEIRHKWNERYAPAHVPNQVIDVLELNLHLLPVGGKSLDLACGLGGNALRMAELGFVSHAWDLADAAVSKVREFAQERHLNINAQRCDISTIEQQAVMQEQGFDVIIVGHFLLREIIPTMITALRPGGLIFYQTFIEATGNSNAVPPVPGESCFNGTAQPGSGPVNSNFRLQKNELLQLFSELTIRYYREDGLQGDLSRGLRNEAMLVAQK